MSKTLEEIKLQDGTLIRHKTAGYEGRIDGTTEIRSCFTVGGVLSDKSLTRQTFQYRVVIAGEPMRRIAPAEDLDILEGVVEVICPHCHYFFRSKPGFADKPGGHCQCGGWICPACLTCQGKEDETNKGGASVCPKQRQRQARKLAARKKHRGG